MPIFDPEYEREREKEREREREKSEKKSFWRFIFTPKSKYSQSLLFLEHTLVRSYAMRKRTK